jgi:hypothetical protein
MNFGKYAIVNTVTYKLQDEPDWFWKIKPFTTNAEIEVSKFLSSETEKSVGEFTVRVPAVSLELAVLEIALTFAGTNIPGESGPIIHSSATFEDVEKIVRNMPRKMVLELWEAVGEACPGHGPSTRKMEIKFEDGEKK